MIVKKPIISCFGDLILDKTILFQMRGPMFPPPPHGNCSLERVSAFIGVWDLFIFFLGGGGGGRAHTFFASFARIPTSPEHLAEGGTRVRLFFLPARPNLYWGRVHNAYMWRVCSQKPISPFLSNWDICDWSCMKYKENNKNISDTFDHNFKNNSWYVMSEVSF